MLQTMLQAVTAPAWRRLDGCEQQAARNAARAGPIRLALANRQRLSHPGFRGSHFSSPIRLAEIVFGVELPQHRHLPLGRGRIPAETGDGLAVPILNRIEFNLPMARNPEQSNGTDFG